MDSASPLRNYPSPHSEDRVRRNVACINCRNSKVRCRTSDVAGKPCQRCAKLELSCVVDKLHKRITKRSKLEQLEQELKCIKQAVGSTPRANAEGEQRLPRSPRNSNSTRMMTDARPIFSQGPSSLHAPLSVSAPAPAPAPASALDGAAASRRPVKAVPTRSQRLGTKVVDGADIDWYFDKYLQHFHPFIPILRKLDPDECFDACPTLFWIVIYVAARRYARDEALFTLVSETIARDIWTLPAVPLIRLEELHAMLIVCAYPIPGTRVVTDPSSMLANACVTACMMQGLHTGKGAHGEFCIGSRQSITCSDEEAACTWMMACILVQHSAVGIGCPPPGTVQFTGPAVRKALSSQTDLLAMFDVQLYLNRMHTAMATHVLSTGSMPESVVASWDDELEMLRPVLARNESDMTQFMMLAAQMEVQAYYFMQSPDGPNPLPPGGPSSSSSAGPVPSLSSASTPASTLALPSINTLRTIRTATRLIATVSTPSSSAFLAHSPNWVARAIIDAATLITSSLHSNIPPSVTDNLLPLFLRSQKDDDRDGNGNDDDGNDDDDDDSSSSPTADFSLIIHSAHAVLVASSVRETDLPARVAAIIETFWSNRDRMPKADCPAKIWSNRLSAGLTFWCLLRFNHGLTQAKIHCKAIYRGLAPHCQPNLQQPQDRGGETPQSFQPLAPSETPGKTDPFQEVDWSLFLDDFGWGGDEPIFMGLA